MSCYTEHLLLINKKQKMPGILDLLNSDLGKTIINGVAGSTGNDSSKTGNVLAMGLPVLMKAMQRNASTPQGADGLLGALSGKHDGSILDNLGDLFKGGVNADVVQDGSKILGHILGNKAGGVEQIISEKAGVDAGSVANILKTAAPILMGVLGKQSRQNGVSSNGIGDLIGGMLGGNSNQQEQSFLEKILDADGDGSVIDDVAGMVLNQGGNKGGGLLGGLLGGLFGK